MQDHLRHALRTVHLLALANHNLQSASYSSTAAALPAHGSVGGSSSYGGMKTHSDVAGIETVHAVGQQRAITSPRSTSSSGTSHGNLYAPSHAMPSVYSPHPSLPVTSAGLRTGPSPVASADLRLAVPQLSAASQAGSWPAPTVPHYTPNFSSTPQEPRASLDYNNPYVGNAPATGLPSANQAYGCQQTRVPSFTQHPGMTAEPRFVALQEYEERGQPTSATHS